MNISAKFLLNSLTNLKQTHPGIIEFIDNSRRKDLLRGKTWPDYVYYPREKLHNAFQRTQTNFYALSSNKEIENRAGDMYNLSEVAHVLYNWRRAKKIYKFSKELTDMLLIQADATDKNSMQLPMELLSSLPHECFFIEADFCEATFGCMIMLDYYEEYDITVLQAFNINRIYLQDKYSKKIGVPECTELSLIPGKTIGECMDHDTKKILSIYNRKETDFTFNRQKADKHQMRLITFLLYLISQNADIKKDPDQAKIYRERSESSPIKDKFREIEIMNVGFNIGKEEIDDERAWDCSTENDKLTLNWVHKDELDESIKQIKALEKLVAELRKENSLLKSEAYESARKAKDIERDYDQLKTDIENDRRELANLRELIFNSQNGALEDKDDESIKLPYYTNKKVTVFGGFISWRTRIKNILPNVRFIDKDAIPNADLIKNSDAIWIQSNAISHSFYYSIINIARMHNIPVRYFTYASARKCAEQFVKEDSK